MSTFGFLEYVQTSDFSNSTPFVPFRCLTFSKTPVERLSRQMTLDPTSVSTSQTQLPRNPDPPDTRTLFQKRFRANGFFDLFYVFLDDRVHQSRYQISRSYSSVWASATSVCAIGSEPASRDRVSRCLARSRLIRLLLCIRRGS